MLTLRGAPALSAFRQEKLARKLCRLHPEIKLLHTEYIHFAEVEQALEGERLERLASLLTYGPELPPVESGQIADATLLLVVPRPGTISPWSSKATDIAHNCGLQEGVRLERGIAY